jgi:hypothetical protein
VENPRLSIKACEALVALALEEVEHANRRYVKALKNLSDAKMDMARSNPHEWFGMQVYRIMGGGQLRTRAEHGIVSFKDYQTPDYGNSHISPGSYYVLVDGKSAHALTKEWELDLL